MNRNKSTFRELVREGNFFEYKGNHNLAEKAYLEALAMLPPEVKGERGKLWINLGSNAQRAGNLKAALEYYKQAIVDLQGLLGEYQLQLAYAHFGTAQTFRRMMHLQDAKSHISTAIDEYVRYPFSSIADRADAEGFLGVVLAELGETPEAIDHLAKALHQWLQLPVYAHYDPGLVGDGILLLLQLLLFRQERKILYNKMLKRSREYCSRSEAPPVLKEVGRILKSKFRYV